MPSSDGVAVGRRVSRSACDADAGHGAGNPPGAEAPSRRLRSARRRRAAAGRGRARDTRPRAGGRTARDRRGQHPGARRCREQLPASRWLTFRNPAVSPVDEEALADDVEREHRERRDQRARHHEGLVRLEAPLEERQPGGQRARVVVLQEDQRDQQLVPDPDGVDHHHRDDRGRRERDDDAHEHAQRARTVDPGRLLEAARNGGEEVHEQVDRERDEQPGVDDDDCEPRVDEAEVDEE